MIGLLKGSIVVPLLGPHDAGFFLSGIQALRHRCTIDGDEMVVVLIDRKLNRDKYSHYVLVLTESS